MQRWLPRRKKGIRHRYIQKKVYIQQSSPFQYSLVVKKTRMRHLTFKKITERGNRFQGGHFGEHKGVVIYHVRVNYKGEGVKFLPKGGWRPWIGRGGGANGRGKGEQGLLGTTELGSRGWGGCRREIRDGVVGRGIGVKQRAREGKRSSGQWS